MGAVVGDCVLADSDGAAVAVVELDLEPFRRHPRERVGDDVLVREQRVGKLVQVGIVEQPALLKGRDQPRGDPIPPLAGADHERHERERKLARSADAGEQFDGFLVAGAAPMAPRPWRGQQSPAQLLGIPERKQLIKQLITAAQHARQGMCGRGHRPFPAVTAPLGGGGEMCAVMPRSETIDIVLDAVPARAAARFSELDVPQVRGRDPAAVDTHNVYAYSWLGAAETKRRQKAFDAGDEEAFAHCSARRRYRGR